MGEVRKIQNRSNEMVDQIKVLISKTFPPALGIEVQYYEGEDVDTERKYLVFSMTSPTFKNIYTKSKRLSEKETFFDIEHDFVGAVLSDFIVLGTTFLTNNVIAKTISDRENADNILKHPFSKGRLSKFSPN